ncbi:CHAT domain-containing protein [Hyalangium versicolor]|uniref:CHAT domain-containing protein n=1 Tax=Hyalangium versicolor TaxID=2861190 RepID=UPI001CCBA6AC|nr:CHAT domain-containing protein [Hyalangium versicolor]
MEGIWTYSFWSDGGTLDLVSWPGWREDLKRLEDPDALRESGAMWEVLERLSQHLLVPVQERLEAMAPSDRLLISPSQALMHVPFAGFRTRAGMLAERVVLSLVTGAGLFEACFDRRPGPISSALLVGVHQHDYRPALPFARDEVKRLERLFEGSARKVRTLLDREATARAVLSAAATYDVVHFACHSLWSPEAAIRPQLALSPEVDRERGEDSGQLTDWRIVGELRLKPGALVNLSACQSARQKEGGAGVRDGLVPAFFRAGAGAVIATLWSIRDAPSPCFQAALYEHLLAGQSPADALALTIRRCIRGELGPALEDPLVWSAFVLHGVG